MINPFNNVRNVMAATVLASAALAHPAWAYSMDDPNGHDVFETTRHHDTDEANVRYDYADVISASPVYQTVRFSEPREECVEEPVVYQDNPNGVGTAIGAVIGGALGSQVGDGGGRDAAVVAGAIVGGVIGNQVDQANTHTTQHVETHCRTIYEDRTEQRLVGYDVEYRYMGEIYYSQMDSDPGNKLRIRISIEPAL